MSSLLSSLGRSLLLSRRWPQIVMAFALVSVSLAFGLDTAAAGTRAKDLKPSLSAASGDVPPMYADGCHGSFKATTPRLCRYRKAPSSAKKVLLYGDSHAAHWFAAVDKLARKRNWSLHVMTKSDCSVTNIRVNLPYINNDPYTSCITWRKKARNLIRKKNFDLVVASDWDQRFVLNRKNKIVRGDERDRRWRIGARDTGDFLARQANGVIWVRAVPDLDTDILGCVRSNKDQLGRCSVSRLSATYRDLWGVEQQALKGIAGVKLLDNTSRICDRERCQVHDGRTLIWRNRNHLTQRFARKQWRTFSRAADAALRS
jgi:hypothetical protein